MVNLVCFVHLNETMRATFEQNEIGIIRDLLCHVDGTAEKFDNSAK